MLPGFDEGLLLPSDNPVKWLEWLAEHGYDFAKVDDAFKPADMASNDEADDDRQHRPATRYAAEHSQTAFLTQHVIDYIDRSKEPWCVHLSYLRPHPPFYAPAPYHNMYALESVPLLERSALDTLNDPWRSVARGSLGDWPEP
jgi:hypothetical protein